MGRASWLQFYGIAKEKRWQELPNPSAATTEALAIRRGFQLIFQVGCSRVLIVRLSGGHQSMQGDYKYFGYLLSTSCRLLPFGS